MAGASGRGTTFSDVLRLPEYRALLIAEVLSQLGDKLASVAIALIIFGRTHSPTLTGLSLALAFLPYLFAGPVLSALADRHPRRTVMLWADFSRAVLIAVVILPGVPVAGILTLVTAVSLLDAPFRAARSAQMPAVAGDDATYTVAMNLWGVASTFSNAAGFALGGVVVLAIGTKGTVMADAVTFLISGIAVVGWVQRRPAPERRRQHVGRDLAEGIRFLGSRPDLLWLAGAAALVQCATSAGVGVAVPYAAAHHAGKAAVGYLTAAPIVGSFFGSVLLARFVPTRLTRPLMLPMALLAPVVMAFTGLNPSVPLAIVVFVVSSALDAMSITANRVFVSLVPDAMRGRAFGVASAMVSGLQGVAILAAGAAVDRVGAATAVTVVSLLTLAAISALSVYAYRHRPEIFADQDKSPEPSTPPADVPIPQSAARPTESRGRRMTSEGRRGSTVHVWLLTGGLALASVALGLHLAGEHALIQVDVPAWWVGLLFLVYGVLPLKFRYRGFVRYFHLESVPLVLGLLFLSPISVVLLRTTALNFGPLLRRKTPVVKLCFNLGQSVFLTELVILLFRVLYRNGSGVTAPSWGPALLADAADSLLFVASVAVVRRLASGSWPRDSGWADMTFTVCAGLICGVLGLMAAAALVYDSKFIWAISVFAGLLTLGMRAHHQLSERHGALDKLYGLARDLGPIGSEPAEFVPALEQLRRLLRADSLELLTRMDTARWAQITVADRPEGDGVRIREVDEEDVGPQSTRSVTLRRSLTGFLSSLVNDAGNLGHELTVVLPTGEDSRSRLIARQVENGAGFESSDLHLLEVAADQVAAAMEKGRLVSKLRRAAELDTLTGLANLDSLRVFLSTTLEHSPGSVLLLLDIDRFQEVNDTLGHDAGDTVLAEVARRLESSLTQGALAARLGGDQFALVIPGQSSGELARLAALAVKSRVDGSMRFDTVSADIRVTVGIARAPEHGSNANTLLRRAEMAMTAAKGSSNGLGEWEPSYEQDGSRRLQLLAGLRQALAENTLGVAYQPKLRLGGGEVTGFEALVRWRHPELGVISPAEFVPLTEASGLISALTSHVLREALATCRAWHDLGKPVGVAVNISARSLDDPVLVGQVAAMLTASGLAPQWLTLEITESSVMENQERALDILRQLRMLGVRLSIDDFGTGYSSLNQLRGLPVHEVKIDRSFIDTIDEGGADRAVVRAIVDLCDSLGLMTVAEGVEKPSQAYELESLGVPIVQGYFYSRPMAPEAATEWLASRPTLAVAYD